jgi:membrane protein implicated in regulation of membrane protease activity
MNFVWLGLLILFVIVEAGTVSMVSAWFAAGALAALIVTLVGAEAWLQVLVFIAVSAAALALLRPIAKKHFTPRLTKTNVDAIVGKTCLCVTTIDNLASTGQVKIGDVEWSARSTTGEPIAVGTQVTVDRVEGVKVYVTPLAVKV